MQASWLSGNLPGMNTLDRIQTFAADRGYGQYPLPRSRPRRSRPDKIGLRLVVGILGLFGVIVLGCAVVAMAIGGAIFIYGAIFG